LFTQKVLSASTGTPLESRRDDWQVHATPPTAIQQQKPQERLKIIVLTEASEIWGLITSNTTSVVTIPAPG